jgi:thioredoxin reductase
MKKVVIGGVSGLAAGIYASMAGFETKIPEKTPLWAASAPAGTGTGFTLTTASIG